MKELIASLFYISNRETRIMKSIEPKEGFTSFLCKCVERVWRSVNFYSNTLIVHLFCMKKWEFSNYDAHSAKFLELYISLNARWHCEKI